MCTDDVNICNLDYARSCTVIIYKGGTEKTARFVVRKRHNFSLSQYIWRSIHTEDTMKPVYNNYLIGYFSAFWGSKGHLDKLQKAEIVN